MKRRKKTMKIMLIIIAILFIIAIALLVSKFIQLNKLKKMTAQDMLSYVTQEEGIFVSMAIIDDGEITYHTYANGGQEITNPGYQYEICSISKTFTAFLIAKAIDEGKLELSASISEYLDLPDGKYYPSIERLLTHTSGYKNYYYEPEMNENFFRGRNSFYGIGKETILKKVASVSLKDKDYPFQYSNFGISVLGLVLESVYQRDYTELLTDYLHNELEMNNSSVATCTGSLTGYWDWAPGDAYIPAGAVISTITDMTKYLSFCMSDLQSYVSLPFTDIKKVDANNYFYVNMGIRFDKIGMTWIHDCENHFLWHNGGTSNFNSYIAMNEEKTKGIVLLSNYGPNKKIPVTVIGPKIMQQLTRGF